MYSLRSFRFVAAAVVADLMLFFCVIVLEARVSVGQPTLARLGVAVRLLVVGEVLHPAEAIVDCDTAIMKKETKSS